MVATGEWTGHTIDRRTHVRWWIWWLLFVVAIAFVTSYIIDIFFVSPPFTPDMGLGYYAWFRFTIRVSIFGLLTIVPAWYIHKRGFQWWMWFWSVWFVVRYLQFTARAPWWSVLNTGEFWSSFFLGGGLLFLPFLVIYRIATRKRREGENRRLTAEWEHRTSVSKVAGGREEEPANRHLE